VQKSILMLLNAYVGAEMKTLVDLGSEFQLLRKQTHKTQTDVAQLTGMQQEALSRFERGRGNDFSLGRLLRMAHALGYELQFVPLQKRPTLTDVFEERKQSANVGPGSR
jgi:transcriptional regulator with XRE-family HTH domain